MMVDARLVWGTQLHYCETLVFITTGSAATLGRAKTNIVIRYSEAPTSKMQRRLLLDSLDFVSWSAKLGLAVDCEIRHLSTGCSEICI